VLGDDLVHQAANANTVKMAITALLVLPFVPLHAALVRRIVPSRKAPLQPSFLDETLIPAPEQAIHAAMRELRRMTELCRESLTLDEQLLDARDGAAIRTVRQNEKTVDAVKLAFRDYLALITSRFLSRRQAVLIQHLDRCMTEIERIGDHIKVLCRLNGKIAPYTGRAFFEPCQNQLKGLYAQINQILNQLSASLDPEHENYEEMAETILAARKSYLQKKDEAKNLITDHVGRNELPPLLGIYLNEYLMTFSKIARHCKAIAGAQREPFFWLKQSKLNRLADEYTEQKVLEELDGGEYLDTLWGINE